MHTGGFDKIFLKLCIFFEIAFLALMLYAAFGIENFRFNLDFWLLPLIPVVIYVVGIILIRVLFKLFSVSIFEDGFYSPGTSFVFRTVVWDEIIDANLMYSSGLRYIQVRSNKSNRLISIPLDIVDFVGFLKNLEEFAGENHILTVAVRNSMDS